MDISDGLAGDLAKMLAGEGRCAEILVADVPLSPAAARAVGLRPELMETVLTGGDDYEILCALPPEALDACRAEAEALGLPLRPIGTVTAGEGPPVFVFPNRLRTAFGAGSFNHF
jgi:thiamine-monophosphate kinase